jgi:hypothetical protein
MSYVLPFSLTQPADLLTIPCFQEYIVQGHRFNIFEDVGYYPAVYNTLLTHVKHVAHRHWPHISYVLRYAASPPDFQGRLTRVLVLSLRIFARCRLEFSRFMNSTSSFLSMGCYFRLMALAMTPEKEPDVRSRRGGPFPSTPSTCHTANATSEERNKTKTEDECNEVVHEDDSRPTIRCISNPLDLRHS